MHAVEWGALRPAALPAELCEYRYVLLPVGLRMSGGSVRRPCYRFLFCHAVRLHDTN